MNKHSLWSLVLLSLAAAGCAERADLPTATRPGEPALGRAASTDILTTFRLTNAADFEVRGDGKYLTADGASQYAHGTCGINSRIFAGETASGDAIMHTSNPSFKAPKCRDYPRKVFVGANGLGEVEMFLNVREMHRTGNAIAVGGWAYKNLTVNPETGACTRFVYQAPYQVRVDRTDTGVWKVSSQPAPNNIAVCESDGTLHPMDVSFTIAAQ